MTDAPKRIVAWPGISGWLCGTWSQTRYPEDGQVYTRADLIDLDVLRRVEAALDHCVEKEVEYMRTNNLGDPEKQHTVRYGRAALTDLRAMMEKINA